MAAININQKNFIQGHILQRFENPTKQQLFHARPHNLTKPILVLDYDLTLAHAKSANKLKNVFLSPNTALSEHTTSSLSFTSKDGRPTRMYQVLRPGWTKFLTLVRPEDYVFCVFSMGGTGVHRIRDASARPGKANCSGMLMSV